MFPPISVVIPVRKGGNPYITLRSLKSQTARIELIVSHDDGRGANWARNRGAERARGAYLLFSDDDIDWIPGAIETMFETLENSIASYCYGRYALVSEQLEERIFCDQPFSVQRLRRGSCISTMSLIRRADFPGFDEAIPRLQDWDLFLTMAANQKFGVYCGNLIFRTAVRDGITRNGPVTWEEARRIVARKHCL
jgi:glycosyltransferase involved in cell wall biosynthesis